MRAACSPQGVEGALESICTLGGPDTTPVPSGLAAAWQACIQQDSDACSATWLEFMAATGCERCVEEICDADERTDAFCRGLRGDECDGAAAPCGGGFVGADDLPGDCASPF